ncbi:MAG TPA: hypothetical protein VEM41_10585 [Actinomycetota bacterium]|nr:hypothetical protein [Actinomycetota bacterium]
MTTATHHLQFETPAALSPEEEEAVRAALEFYREITSARRSDRRADEWARSTRPEEASRTEPSIGWQEARDRARALAREAGE